MALPSINILEDTFNFLSPDKGVQNFILWDTKKLRSIKKGQEDQAIAVEFSSMGMFFDRALISKPMMRPNERGDMILGGFNFLPRTISFDAYKTAYGRTEQEFYTTMNNCIAQVEKAWQNHTLITIQPHFPLTTLLENYVINEAYILIGEKTRTILGFRINMLQYRQFSPDYEKVDPEDAGKPTYANGDKL